MLECLFYRWLLYWAMIVDGIIGVLTLGATAPFLSPLAAKLYQKCILRYGYGEEVDK